MAAHDSILESQVKQVRATNRKRRTELFKEGGLVFIGPYKIIKDFENHSFRIDLPSEYLARGIHPVFHASLLCVHVPNDDRRFPSRLPSQLGETPQAEGQWKISRILSHSGSCEGEMFEVEWTTGDKTWLSYSEVCDMPCFGEYLDLLGIGSIEPA
ncbi:hypothetical protein PM082_024744 [Marasmius tenuissimus]|nr:hypothetical protein PM082_024744 [Marasmius tenuissimus]